MVGVKELFHRRPAFSNIALTMAVWIIVSATVAAQQSFLADPNFVEGPLIEGPLIEGPVEPPLFSHPERAESFSAEPFDPEAPIQKFRPSFFQGFDVRGGTLLDWGDEQGGLDQTFQEIGASFGVPLGSLDNILAVRPFFAATQLSGPTTIDVPETLYDTGVALFNRKVWTPTISTTVVVSPTVRSDFTTGDDALRIFGLGLINWQSRPSMVWSAGVLYLDRADVGILPVAGFVWTPKPTLKVNGMLPNPGIARRIWKDGGRGEAWASIGGSFGGNTWAVTRTSGDVDQLTLRDYRLLADYAVIRPGNRGWSVATGFAFGRSIEYERGDVELDLDNAWFLEAALRF